MRVFELQGQFSIHYHSKPKLGNWTVKTILDRWHGRNWFLPSEMGETVQNCPKLIPSQVKGMRHPENFQTALNFCIYMNSISV